jgi:predicted nucleotidyltransferase
MTETTSRDGLQDHQRRAILKVLSHYPQVAEARLYGSRALGSYREGSDIDLTLLGEIDLATLNRISLELDELLLPWEIDLSVFEWIESPGLCDHIERVGIRFYQKE